MPFDGSGNFSRTQNFTQDRNSGIKILASHVDGEFDNFASAMNQSFFRTGLVPMSGDLSMGSNRIAGIGDGAASSPAIRFANDPATGFYLAGFGKIGIATGGNSRLELNSGGAAVTGSLTVSSNLNAVGTISQNGAPVVTGAAANFTSDITATRTFMPALKLVRTSVGYWNVGGSGLADGDNSFYVRLNASDVGLKIDTNLAVSMPRTLNVAQSIAAGTGMTVGGFSVWHAGNFAPTDYLSKGGGDTSGTIRTNTGGGPGLDIRGAQPYQQMSTAAGQRLGFFQHSGTGGYILLNNEQGGGFQFIDNGLLVTSFSSAGINTTRAVAAGTGMTVGGFAVWHAGNFAPAQYANLSGATFSGPVGAQSFTIPGTFGVTSTGSTTNVPSTINNTLNVTGALTQNGQQVYHTGNFSASSYAALSGATFTGAVAGTSFNASGAVSAASMTVGGFGVYHAGNFNPASYAALGGANFTGALQQSGNQVYHAGNFNPGNYAALSGATFTGPVTTASLTRGGSGKYYHSNDNSWTGDTISRGTAGPSGGADGDIYYQYS